MRLNRFIFFFLLTSSLIHGQNGNWTHYMSEATVDCQVLNDQYLWAGTYSYLSRINTVTGTRELFFHGKRITSLAVDKDGSVWAGRYDGLFKYDGQSWIQYSKANSGIPDEYVCRIFIDNYGNKWLRTHTIGLVKFDGKTWKSFGKPKISMNEDNQSPLAVDSAGNAWMGFHDEYNCAMAKFDGKSWTLYDTSKIHAGNYVSSIVFDPKGIMWAATDKGIVKYDGTNWTVDNYKDFISPSLSTYSIVFDKNGSTWVANNSGLYKSNGSGWTKYILPNSETTLNIPRSLSVDSQGNLLVGADKGLWKFDGNKWTAQKTSNSAFTSQSVGMAYTDSSRIRWFTDINGLVRFDGVNWTLYDTSNGLPAVRVSSIAFDKDGNKWFGSYKGLIKYDDKTWTVYKLPDLAGQFWDIYAVSIDPKGIIWLVTGNHKLLRFDGTNWTVYTSTNSKLPNGALNYSIYIDAQGTKWFPTDYGIVSFNDKDWTVYNPNDQGSYFSVTKITADPQGVIWTFGGSGMYNFHGENWTYFSLYDLGLPNSSPTNLAIDNSGNKWIATQRGLVKYDGTSAKVFTELNSGLLDDEVLTVSTDADGNIYITYFYAGALSVFHEDNTSADAASEENRMPENYSLIQNYPNPFNPETTISYSIPIESFVELKVYDVLGREVTTLISSLQKKGEYKVEFNGSSLPSGMYVYSIQAGEFRASKKLLLIK